MHDMPNKAIAQLYRCLTTQCESSSNKHHMEEQKSVFNLKQSNCLGFRLKDTLSITEMILLMPSFRNLTLGSVHCQREEAIHSLNILCHPLEPGSLS